MAETPWRRHTTQTLVATPRYGAHRDQVTRPDGQPDTYDWVSAPDRVRVAAIVDGELLVTEQAH